MNRSEFAEQSKKHQRDCMEAARPELLKRARELSKKKIAGEDIESQRNKS